MATTIKAGPEMPSDEYSTPSHVDSCGLFDLDQTKTLQRSNFYAPMSALAWNEHAIYTD